MGPGSTLVKVGVVGLWHLGTVTAACLAAAGHRVVAVDNNAKTVEDLIAERVPVAEPGLQAMVSAGIESGHLQFTSVSAGLNDCDVVWFTYDTPVDEEDCADVDFVVTRMKDHLSRLDSNPRVLISSQLPAGTTAKLERFYNEIRPLGLATFAYSPENLRLGQAIQAFSHPARVVIGIRHENDKACFAALFEPFTDRIEWMSVESAEMSKHALNAFLATSVAFANELAVVCENAGADARDVERALRGDPRIGSKAYLRAGNAFAGGTLARDLTYLVELGRTAGAATGLFDGVLNSNRLHLQWAQNALLSAIDPIAGQQIAVLGLTYKPGTNTLRRSSAVETCRWLSQQGAKVVAYDPAISELPDDLRSFIELCPTLEDALRGSSAAVVATEWPAFAEIASADVVRLMKTPVVLDAGRFLEGRVGSDRRIQYVAVGRPT